MILSVLIGISLFVFLIFKHKKLQYKFNFNKALIHINETELKVLNGDYLGLDDGSKFIDPKHPYSYDIDLFGRGSFFNIAIELLLLKEKTTCIMRFANILPR